MVGCRSLFPVSRLTITSQYATPSHGMRSAINRDYVKHYTGSILHRTDRSAVKTALNISKYIRTYRLLHLF